MYKQYAETNARHYANQIYVCTPSYICVDYVLITIPIAMHCQQVIGQKTVILFVQVLTGNIAPKGCFGPFDMWTDWLHVCSPSRWLYIVCWIVTRNVSSCAIPRLTRIPTGQTNMHTPQSHMILVIADMVMNLETCIPLTSVYILHIHITGTSL